MQLKEAVDEFMAGEVYAVAGASQDRRKYGNKVLRAYLQVGKKAYPVNPNCTEVEGVACVRTAADLPGPVHGLSIVTPPNVTRRVVQDALAAGIRRFWMQPGAESKDAIDACLAAGASCIHGGPCVLVALRFRES